MFRVTTIIQFASTKSAFQILVQYAHDFEDNLTILYSKFITNNDFDHKSYDVRQHVLMYSVLLKLYTDALTDCIS